MSWDVVNPSYLAMPISGQIRDLSTGIRKWAEEFEKSLDDKVQATFIVTTCFIEKSQHKEVIIQRFTDKYNVVNDGKKGDDFKSLIAEIKKFALGRQSSFGIFVQMEDEEPPEWSLSIQEKFLGCVIQDRGYTRKKMLENLTDGMPCN